MALFFSDTKQLFCDYFPESLISGADLCFVVIVAVVLSGNVPSQYLMGASSVVTLCVLPDMQTFITSQQLDTR